MYVYALSFFEKSMVLQLTVVNLGSLLIFIYLVTIRPYETFLLNALELVNECFTLILSYFCWIFTDYQPDLIIKY